MRKSLNMYSMLTGLMLVSLVTTPRGAFALGGIEGTFEYAFDAPWRMEPYDPGNGQQLEYGAIPIQLSIHDAMHAVLDKATSIVDEVLYGEEILGALGLGNFCWVTIREPGSAPLYSLQDLAEVEMTQGAWLWPTGRSSPPSHEICRAWAGEDCEAFRNISRTSEWHALLWHTPSRTPMPGSVLSLGIEMRVTRRPWIACDGTISGFLATFRAGSPIENRP